MDMYHYLGEIMPYSIKFQEKMLQTKILLKRNKPRSVAPKKLSGRDENAVYLLSRQGPSNSISNITAEFNETLKEVLFREAPSANCCAKKNLICIIRARSGC
jgi:hypothetical protein